MSCHARAGWSVTGLATVLSYNTWVLWSPVNGHAEIFSGYLSEFSAFNQPHNLFFRGGDRITAVLVGALSIRALLTWRRRRPRRRWWLVSAAALALFAVSTFLDSFFSMDCSPTLSVSCKVLEETGRLSLTHYAHTYTSTGAETGIVASMIAADIAMVATRGGGLRWRRGALGVTLGEVGLLTIMMVMLGLGLPGIGIPQAGMVALASLWFAGVGVSLGRRGPDEVGATAVAKRQASYVG